MDAPRQAVSDSSLLLTLGLNHLLAMATLIDEIIKFLSAIGSLVKDVKELAQILRKFFALVLSCLKISRI